jgi:hypothetical protein
VSSPDPSAAARAVALEAARAYQSVFADRLLAAYALGSVAHGGYAEAVSDIDLAVILSETRDGDAEIVHTTREPLHRKLSVFWSSLPALRRGEQDGRFPAVDRLDLHDHGGLLLGAEVAGEVAVPTPDELLLDGAYFAAGLLASEDMIAECHQPRRLLADPVWFTKAVLFPVRFGYTEAKTTGSAAPNDEAIAWYLAEPDPVAPELVRLAARVRQGHPLDAAEVAPLLAEGLIPLYEHYITDHTRRLRAAHAPADLIDAFTRWREQLAGPAT